MKTSFKNRKKQLLAIFLSLMMTSSVAALAACSDSNKNDSSSSSSSTTTDEEQDNGLIKNATFKTFNKNDGANLIGTSATGWTRSLNSASSGSALSSKSASGIIDVSEEAWANLTQNKVSNIANKTEDEMKALWDTDNITAKDKLEYYEAWEDANDDGDIDEDLSFYQSFNIDTDDLPTCKNPGTREGAEDTNILMIHNEYNSTRNSVEYKTGTAQKYTSSSTVTIKAGMSAELSVWVKTSDLECATTNGTTQDVVGKGAYISVTHSIGGRTMDAFEVKNIVADEWTQYTFFLRGASYIDTTFSVVLGLGKGGGTDRLEYVNGYAFFDDLECNLMPNTANENDTDKTNNFDSKTEGLETVYDYESTKEEKVIDASASDLKTFALDYYGDQFSPITFLDTVKDIALTSETSSNGTNYNVANYPGLEGIATADDVTKLFANVDEMNGSDNKYLASVYKNYFEGKNLDFLAEDVDDKILMLLSAHGASYTAKSNQIFSVPEDGYLAVSFFVKTSDMNGFTGAGVTLHDGNNKNEFTSIDTTTIDPVEIGSNEDVYQGWQQCFFFVKNETDTEKDFTLSFSFGPTTVIGTTKNQYYAGFAAFTGFTQKEMTAAEFESASSGTYTKIVSLTGTVTEAEGDSGFDSAAIVPSGAIEEGFANPKNYKGVYSDSAYITNDGMDMTVNQNKTAGLLNKEYADNYGDIISAMQEDGSWSTLFGNDATQPLVIYNGEGENAADKPYGFIGQSTTVAANTYKTVSLRVKVSANANAYVYLIDMDDDTHASALSIDRKITYWYDEDGNVCSVDPSSEDFNNKKDVALKLQANGLYKVNASWEGAANVAQEDNVYYANLQAYEGFGKEVDLKVAEGGASYNYNDKWDNEGVDGVAYYYKDGNYHADRACSGKYIVKDLSEIADLPTRYEATTSEGFMFKVAPTNGDWAIVTFYLHTGATAKNYRLEVWNGDRTGGTVAEDSYVIFDAYTFDDVDETSFADLLKEKEADVDDANKFESVFSFFDSASYLRYNEKLDENEVGYAYESYSPAAQVSGTAYLKYEGEKEYKLFADYALSDVTVTPDADTDDSTTEDEDDHDHGNSADIWLLASSIAIAVVLLFAVASIIIRKVVQNARKKKAMASRNEAKNKKDKKN
ncbi:MAG: hypothetical protein IJX87_03435 [Clostridia bacterium]|nr:hypothetical protein [Clostridia bacterium]